MSGMPHQSQYRFPFRICSILSPKRSRCVFGKFKRAKRQKTVREESDDYPTLAGLVGGYFHQDYDIISEDGDEVVAAFRDETLPAVHQSLMADIHRFLDRYGADEKQLTGAFERVFTPETAFHRFWGRTTREALLKVVEIVSAPATPSYRPEDRG